MKTQVKPKPPYTCSPQASGAHFRLQPTQRSGFRVQGLGFRVCLGFRASGAGFRVDGTTEDKSTTILDFFCVASAYRTDAAKLVRV